MLLPKHLETDKFSDGFIQASKQGFLGDCWLLSQINALSDTKFGASAIQNCITDKHNGTYSIKFKNLGEEYEITQQDITKARNSRKYSSGDLDVLLLELAFEKHYKYAANKEGKEITNVLQGGNYNNDKNIYKYSNQNIIKILTGAQTYDVKTTDKETLDNHLKTFAQNLQDVAVTFSSDRDIETGQKLGINRHAYSIKRVELDTDNNIKSLIIIDPNDSSKEIKMDYQKFLKFQNITVQTSVLDNSLIEAMNRIDINSKIDKLNNAERSLDFALQFSNPTTRNEIIKEFGGIQKVRDRFIELINKDFEKEEEILKNTPKDELDEEQKIMVQITKEQRYDNDLKAKTFFFYNELGLNDNDLGILLNEPDKWQEILPKYGYN